MSYHYWRNCGRTSKTRFITLANSYHGETLGALGVSNVPLYQEIYQPLLREHLIVPSPDCFWRAPGEDWEHYSRRAFEPMAQALAGTRRSLRGHRRAA